MKVIVTIFRHRTVHEYSIKMYSVCNTVNSTDHSIQTSADFLTFLKDNNDDGVSNLDTSSEIRAFPAATCSSPGVSGELPDLSAYNVSSDTDYHKKIYPGRLKSYTKPGPTLAAV